ncbi:MAG: outer membrane protein assembly factor BamE [Proteobacteria bacterium]|nr:outer membrane protein assembly factor BamE [Pseudomonadota bacterium]MBU1569441.1 outer membrane protein assembly factor BamE [Pseudomonadota bacterium]MBU2623410.1 outer membrane protein assembly factor BamE [Pseudomonadota bacterium]
MKAKTIVMLVCIYILSGCAGVTISGKTFDTTKVRSIQKGTTTKSDIRAMCGEPVSTRPTESGEVWSYYYQSVNVFINKNHSLDVDFDKAGVVIDYRYKRVKSLY